MADLKVNTPAGTIIVEEKGSENEYPGVYVYLQDHKGNKKIVACVEYCGVRKKILIESYCDQCDEPTNIFSFVDGLDLIN